METRRVEHMCGGVGHVLIKEILDKEQLNGKCRLYAQVTLEPGCSLGFHEHHEESETYYIISGKGIYSDNGTLRMVEAGEMTFTPNGKGHAMTNAGEEDLVFMALINHFGSISPRQWLIPASRHRGRLGDCKPQWHRYPSS